MRVPTYNSYMNMLNQTMNTKSLLDLYNYQTMTGIKAPNYSGFGMQAHTMVSLEAMLGVTSNFMENNKLVQVEVDAMATATDSIQKAVNDFKSILTSVSGMDLEKASPDITGGELIFTSDDKNDYLGKTITVDGTQYTFADNGNGNNIDISAATNANEIMAALQNKLPANADFKFEDNKFTFPLYTIDGESSIIGSTGVETGEPHVMSDEQYNEIKTLQNQAFATLRMLVDCLNTNVNGKYIFGGGESGKAPVNFPFSSLEEFQAYYDGVNIKYPSSSSAALNNKVLDANDTGDLTLAQTGGNTGTITAANAGAFLSQAVSANDKTTGNLKFDTFNNTITATEYGAFNTINAGDTLVIGGNGAGANAKVYVVKSVSEDGKTITLDDSTPVEADMTISPDNTDPAKTVNFSTSYPIGSVINMEGFDKNIASQVQVTGVSADGSTLFVTADPSRFPNTTIAASKDWSLVGNSYYQGGTMDSEKVISDNQSIVFDVNGADPAFEKLFRSLCEIAQGGLIDSGDPTKGEALDPNRTADRVENAIKTLQSALYSSGFGSSENNADLYTVLAKTNSNQVILNNVTTNQKAMSANLQDSIGSIKNVDQTEAAIKSLMAYNNLNASYAVLQKSMELSILNYL